MEKKNILLCVAGMTPQIITETLYALTQDGEKITIDEIRVITTLEGRNKVLKSLLDEKEGKFFEFCRDFDIDAGEIKFDETTIALLDTPDGKMLDDIRTKEDNTLAGDKICKIVGELCRRSDARIHASAAGGRKTMSIYLTAAMQLFGRADDTLSHVLVNADFETNPQFFYPPPQPQKITLRDGREISTSEAKIHLAEVPFVRLQGTRAALTLREGQSYSDLVRQAQTYLDTQEKNFPLRIDLQNNQLSVGELKAHVSDYQLLLFVLFAGKKFSGAGDNRDGFVYLNSLRREDFETAFQKIMTAKQGEECPFTEARLNNTDWKFLLTVVEQCESGKDKDYEDFMNSVIRSIGKANKDLRKAGFPPKYEITSKGNSRPKKYGLDIPKEQIEQSIS